ncbi:MAG: aminopeptidase [Magnetococcales bacterium]|nr:aminopeptidase [Magnetococcales bacterium]
MQSPRLLWILLSGLLVSGCTEMHYYLQAAGGQWDLVARRQAVDRLLADPATPRPLQQRLTLAMALRRFGVERLDLPDSASYRTYADLERPFAVWAVFVTPPLALEPVAWCFPVVGCLSYRGYFRQRDAEDFAADQQALGRDVYLTGVPAYSTLGWFSDSLLNTYLQWPEDHLAGLIFHEMAHERLYVTDDTPFNESYAEAVAQVGVERWLGQQGRPLAPYRQRLAREAEFVALVSAARARLGRLYAGGLDDGEKRLEKARILADLRARYQALRANRTLATPFLDAWFEEPLNNAKLASVATYNQWVPAFLALLRQEGDDLQRWHQAARQLGDLPPAQRLQRLESLTSGAPPHG